MGFEPMIRVLQTLALASWPRRLERLHFIKDPCAGQGQKKKPLNQGFFRAGDGTRTHDLLLGKETFYQLSHARMLTKCEQDFTRPSNLRQPFFLHFFSD